DAEKIAKTELFVNRDDFPNLEEDEFYHVDLIGLNVINQEDVIVGKVKNIYDFGAGEMLEIEFLESNKNLNLEKIETFAFKNEFFPEIKIKSGTIKLSIPEINIVKN
ncbi:MAG: 16S rRNA processing protein RimM, partial [Chlamydiae bacterium]|nr:16S rRNA processing protein RimM [Chlamydiota bacterium]